MISHTDDVTAIPELLDLLKLVETRLSLTADEAVASQPDFERELREHTLRFERSVHAMDFERMDVDVPGLVTGGERFVRRSGKTIGHYTTLAGPVSVSRTTYRQRGGHGGKTIAALDLRLGLIDGHWTATAAQVAATFMASCPSAEAETLLAAAGTMAPSSSHLDRVTKHVGALWEDRRVAFETEVREAERLDLPSPEAVGCIAISLDGIMVPMKDAPRTPGLGKKDQGPKGHKEASCGTVFLLDSAGARLHTVRFGRMPQAHKRVLHQQLRDELRTLTDLYPHAKVIAVADGAQENWRIVGEIARELGCEISERLDFFHGVQHLVEGLRAAGVPDDEIRGWRSRLKDEPGVIESLIEELGVLSMDSGKKVVEKTFNYFINNADRVDYAEAAAHDQPIGSGVQEAACKTLVAQRMKRSGMSWRTPGGQAVLTLRSLAQSGRLNHAWGAIRPTLPVHFDIDSDQRRKRPAKQAA
jgi:hypothetical protein